MAQNCTPCPQYYPAFQVSSTLSSLFIWYEDYISNHYHLAPTPELWALFFTCRLRRVACADEQSLHPVEGAGGHASGSGISGSHADAVK